MWDAMEVPALNVGTTVPQGETDAVTDGLLHLLGTDASKVCKHGHVPEYTFLAMLLLTATVPYSWTSNSA